MNCPYLTPAPFWGTFPEGSTRGRPRLSIFTSVTLTAGVTPQLRFHSGFALAVAFSLGLRPRSCASTPATSVRGFALKYWALCAINSVDDARFSCHSAHMYRIFIFYSLDGQPIFACSRPLRGKIDHLNGLFFQGYWESMRQVWVSKW